jgi:DNA modification methylase
VAKGRAVTVRIIHADVTDGLRQLPDESVHVIATSPPYYGLRSYRIPPSVWGGDPACEHEWGEEHVDRSRATPGVNGSTLTNDGAAQALSSRFEKRSAFCVRCNAWRGELGLEPTYTLYIEHIVEVFREARRVLRKDGVLWLNLGDTYATGAGAVGDQPGGGVQGDRWVGRALRDGSHAGKNLAMAAMGPMTQPNRLPQPGMKAKDLMGIPWEVAFALRRDGWWLRAGLPWVKRNGMSSSVTDRPTVNCEYVFLLTKSERYFYDHVAVLMPPDSGPSDLKKMAEKRERIGGKHKVHDDAKNAANAETNIGRKRSVGDPDGRFRRVSDWFYESLGLLTDDHGDPLAFIVNNQALREEHYAAWPPKLVEPMILAGTSEKGCCPACGAPWKRIVRKGAEIEAWKRACGANASGAYDGAAIKAYAGTGAQNASEVKARILEGMRQRVTVGWERTCSCDMAAPIPCTALDIFGGSGTTALVADRLQRNAILIEIGEQYIEMEKRRITRDAPLFTEIQS